MRKFIKKYWIVLIIWSVIIGLNIYYHTDLFTPDINRGECYIRTIIHNNPFHANDIDTVIILEAKDGYLQYKTKSDYIGSTRIKWFVNPGSV